MKDLLKKLYGIGVVPVVKIDDLETALPIAKALCEGGVPCIEITFRTAHAAESIKMISQAYPQMLIGAGTVLTPAQADQAMEMGATFIVSPGLNPNLVSYCIEKGYPILPGCSTASDVERAIELGLDTVKFFPAEAAGGIKMIKSLAGPYTNIKYMPTGGITEKNINDYLSFDKIIACGGSYLVTNDLVKSGNYQGIVDICRKSIKAILGLEVLHVGINAANEAEHTAIANELGAMTFSPCNTGNSSTFVGTGFEVMKTPFLGANGHIALGVNDVERAVAYYEMLGYSFKAETAKHKNGKLIAIYFEKEIGGFAYHLVQKAK